MPLVLASPYSWVFIGIALLLVWLATYYLLSQVANLIGTAGAIGRAIRDAIMGGLNAISSWAFSWAKTAIDGVVEWIAVPIRAVYDFAAATGDAIHTASYAIGQVAAVASGAVGQVARDLVSLAGKLTSLAAKVGAAAATAAAAYTLSRTLRDSTIPQARQSAINTSATFTTQRVGAEAVTRGRAIDDVRLDLGRAIDGEANTRAAKDAAIIGAAAATAAQLGQRIRDAEAGARTHTNTRVGEVEGQLTNLRDVAIPAALTAALAATAVVARTLAQTTARCINPMCSTFGTQADLWRALMTGAELALVLSLVGNAVRDPEGSAAGMAGMAGSMRSLGNGLLSPIIGVSV